MTAVLAYARSRLRQRWRSWVGIVLLIGLFAGAVLTLAAGARRTDSAYNRFLRTVNPPDVLLFLATDPGTLTRIAQLPEVAQSATETGLAAGPSMAVAVLDDPALGHTIDRFKLLSGRWPRADRPDEALVSYDAAHHLGLRVGSVLALPLVTGQDGSHTTVRLRVVGVEAAAGELPPQTVMGSYSPVYLSSAFLRTPVGRASVASAGRIVGMMVRLRHGPRQVPAFISDAERVLQGPAGSSVLTDQSLATQRSVHQQAAAVWLMAGFAALAAALILAQLLVRQLSDDADDTGALRALGMTPRQAGLSALVRVGAAGVAGSALAVLVAFLASPLLPLGSARVAEPHPGFAFDATALGVGAAAATLAVLLLGTVALAVRRPASAPARSAVAGPRVQRGTADLARLPLPLAATTGVRLAVQPGRGRSAVPVRTTLAAAAVGIAAMTGAVTFGHSLTHLMATPRLYGVSFDADLVGQGNFTDIRPFVPAVRADPQIEAAAVGWTGTPMRSRGVSFSGMAAAPVRGTLDPTLLHGRPPAAPDEILLGAQTAQSLHATIGQTIPITVADLTKAVSFRIVGLGVMAPFNATEQLGRGAVVTPAGIQRFAAAAPPGFPYPPPGDLLVRFRPNVPAAAGIAEITRRLGGPAQVSVMVPEQPADVADFGQVSQLPQLLAGLLALMAAAATAHLLVSSIRRRRRELALLKTLGLVPRQLSAVVAWQAGTVAVIALLVGLPAGVALGRWLWFVIARQVGVVPVPVVPWAFVALIIPAALVVANLVAAGPAIAAGRIRAAAALRGE